jgi:hypothetical protein
MKGDRRRLRKLKKLIEQGKYRYKKVVTTCPKHGIVKKYR